MTGLGETASSTRPRVLLADTDAALLRRAGTALGAAPLSAQIDIATSLDEAESLLRAGSYDAVIASLELSSEPLRVVERLRALTEGVLLITGSGSISVAVETMRRGAADFIIKPFTPEALTRKLMARLGERESAPAPSPAPVALSFGAHFEGFIGASPAMQDVYAQVERMSPSRAPVFVTGESGTGKDVCAEAIHVRSRRRKSGFVALNCGAIPRDLMESEIFGHMRGAFTGATEDRPGAAELADGGTLFLDEICEMDLGLQAKLLRFIQTGELRRVGDTRTRSVNVRFVCATNRNPRREVELGRFREDLFYRLHVLPIHLPPLRERGEDTVTLARAFLARFAAEEQRAFHGFDLLTERLIAAYDWPGNVRQLQNVVRRMVVLHEGERITADMLPSEIARGVLKPAQAAEPVTATASSVSPPAVIMPMWMQEQRIIEDAMKAFDGNIAKAAAALDISPSTIYRKRLGWATHQGAAE